MISGVGSRRVELAAERTTIGKSTENEIAVDDDATASGLHAVLERFAAGWCVTDLGSSNGTWVNGERIWASRRLRHGDDITEPASTRANANESLRRGAVSLTQLRGSE